jgi:hypothetical protein
LGQTTAPGTVTDKLYNVAGDLHWSGYEICDASGNCSGTGAGLGGSGTANYISKFTAEYSLGDSIIYDTGTALGIGTTAPTSLLTLEASTAAALQINPFGTLTGETGELRFLELAANGVNYTGFKAPDSLTGNLIYTLPSQDGSEDYVLTTTGSGVLTWKSITGAGGGTGTITAVGSITSGDAFASSASSGEWLGLGASAGRITFIDSTTDYINLLGANVGIGTTAPTSLFSVGTTSQFQVDSAGAIAAATGITSSGNIDLSSLSVGGMVKADETTGRLSIATAGTDYQAPLTAGTDYEVPLTFENGLTRATDTITLGGALTQNTRLYDASHEYLFFDVSTGMLGIGTTAPSEKLHLEGRVLLGQTTAPGTVTNKLYNVAGDLHWSGYEICDASGNCAGSAAGIGGDGTTGYLARFTSQYEIGDSLIYDSGTALGIGTTAPTSLLTLEASTAAALQINPFGTSAGQTGEMRFLELAANGVNYTGFKAPDSLAGNVIYTLPTADGTENYVLTTSGTGVLTWQSVTDAGAGTGTITAVGSITSGDAFASSASSGEWLGLGASAGRITFIDSTTDYINLLGANVGIGTTAPTSLFSVGTTSQFQVDSAGAIAAATGITSSGNIDLSSLSVGGMVKADETTGRLSIATAGTDYQAPLTAGTDYEVPLTFENGLTRATDTITLGGALTQDTRLYNASFEFLFFDNTTGRIGIGTTAPAYTLDVSGDIRIADNSDLYIQSEALRGTVLGTRVYTSGNYVTTAESFTASIDALDIALYNMESGSTGLWINETGYIRASNVGDLAGTLYRIYDTGGVSIGRDSDPGAGSLYVYDTLTIGSSTLTLQNGLISSSIGLNIKLGDALGTYAFNIKDSADANLLTIDSTGNLSLVDGTAAFSYGSGSSDAFTITNAGTGLSFRVNDQSGDTTPFVIDADGKVGIGTTAPTSALSVGSGSQFQVDSSGNILKINNVTYSWPSAVGEPSQVLTYNESGVLTWGAVLATDVAENTLDFMHFKDDMTLDATTTVNFYNLDDLASYDYRFFNSSTSAEIAFFDGTTGRVGIGTTAPTHTLNVAGNIGLIADAYLNWGATSGIDGYGFRDNSGTLQFKHSSGTWEDIGVGGGAASLQDAYEGGNTIELSATHGDLRIFNDGGNEILFLDEVTGRVGIGTTAPGFKLDVISEDTTGVLGLTANAVTTGTAASLSVNGLTSGTGLSITSASNALTTGSLLSLDWSPTLETVATGDLFKLNIGSNASLQGNLMGLYNNDAAVFVVSPTQITSAVPHQFTAPGDVSVAYDMVFTNQTSSFIKSYGPFTIEAGEPFENNNLSFKTYGTGSVIMDLTGTGNLRLQGTDTSIVLDTRTAGDTDFWLGIIDDGLGDDDDFFAIGKGTVPGLNRYLNIDSTGKVGIGVNTPSEALDISGRIRLAQSTAPGTTADKLYNIGGNLYWNGMNVTGGGALPAGTSGQTIRHTGTSWAASSFLYNSGTAIGIGTTNPGAQLEVAGNFRATGGGNHYFGSDAQTESTSLVIRAGGITTSAHEPILRFRQGGEDHWDLYTVGGEGTNADYFGIRRAGAINTSFTISTDGKVGIGTDNPDASLHVIGNALISGYVGIGHTDPAYQLQLSEDSAAKPTSNTWTVASDERLKKDITAFNDGLDIIKQIDPVSYKLNGLAGMPLNAPGIGVIAQDMLGVAPYTIKTFKAKLNPGDTHETELFSFDSSALTFVAINAIKELDIKVTGLQDSVLATQTADQEDPALATLQTDVDDMSLEIDSLKNQLSEVKGNLTSLEQLVDELINDSLQAESTETEEEIMQTPEDILAEMNSIFDQFKNFIAALGISSTEEEGLLVSSDMNVLGDVTLGTLTLTGDLHAGLVTIDSLENSINVEGPSCLGYEINDDFELVPALNAELCESQALFLQKNLAGNINIFDGQVVIQPNGTLKIEGTLVADKVVADEFAVKGASEMVGNGELRSGVRSVVIENTNVRESSKIFVTPTSSTSGQSLIVTEKVDGISFTVSIDYLTAQNIEFDWWILNVEDEIAEDIEGIASAEFTTETP